MQVISKILCEPIPNGFMPFPATKNRMLNLHKLLPRLVAMSVVERQELFSNAVNCGALDVVIFLLCEGICDEKYLELALVKDEVARCPGMLVFLHQVFPHTGIDRHPLCGDWRFPFMGHADLNVMEEAIAAMDPVSVIKILLYGAHSEALTVKEKAALGAIRCDEARHFMIRLLSDFISNQDMEKTFGSVGGQFNKATGMIMG